MKKIICLVLAAIMIFALVACNSTQGSDIDSAQQSEIELEQHKIAAKERLDAYVIEKGEDNYTAENWAKMNDCVETGKASIDEATNKQEVDDKILKAKGDMDDIPIIAFDIVEFSGWKSVSGMLNNRIKLSNFRNDVVYECSVDGGNIHSEKSSGKEGIVSPDEIIQWFPSEIYKNEQREHLAFMEIRVKSGENIVGYALLEFYDIGFYYVEEEPYAQSDIVEAVSYQPVRLITEAYTAKSKLSFTEEYVDEMIDKAKNYTPILSEEVREIFDYVMQRECISAYYGEYNGTQVIVENTLSLATTKIQLVGVRFSWSTVYVFWAIKDGNIYTLNMRYWGYDYEQSDALENGILTQRDIEIIGGLYGRLKNK